MGAITRAAANNITTGGIILPAGINDASVASIDALAQVSAGDGITLISSQTASASTTIDITSGIDSTYRTYLFKFINLHTSINDSVLQFNFSTDGGSSYAAVKTSTTFIAYHNEADTDTAVTYYLTQDLAQSAASQNIAGSIGSANDSGSTGYMYLFNPSSTTYVKHFIGINSYMDTYPYTNQIYFGGYANTTSAINAFRIKMNQGNIDDGTVQLYGIT
jgi:hypothetical protein